MIILLLFTTKLFGQEGIENIIDNILLRSLEKNNAENGIVIFSNIKNPNENYSVGFKMTKAGFIKDISLINQPIQPGGFMIPISAAVLIDQFNVSNNDSIDLEGGKTIINGNLIYDSENHDLGNTSLLNIVSKSSNVGIAKFVSSRIKSEEDVKLFNLTLNNYILSDNFSTSKINDKTLFSDAIGYGVKLSPLEIFNFYSNIATEKYSFKNSKTKEEIRKSFEEVMETGTGSLLSDVNNQFAGKSATIKTKTGNINKSFQYYSGFTGYSPRDNPKYVCMVIIKCKPNAAIYYGASVAGPLFKEIILTALARENKIDK